MEFCQPNIMQQQRESESSSSSSPARHAAAHVDMMIKDDEVFSPPLLQQQQQQQHLGAAVVDRSTSTSAYTTSTSSSSSVNFVVVDDYEKRTENMNNQLFRWWFLLPPLLGVIFACCFPNSIPSMNFFTYEKQERKLSDTSSTLEGDAQLLHVRRQVRLVLMPKATDDAFFLPSKAGCENQAKLLTSATGDLVTCIYEGPLNNESHDKQALILQSLIDQRLVDGIAISVRQEETITPVIDYAMKLGIPVVTFDSDAPKSKRISYIGTEQYFMGEQIGKILKQLRPQGGTYATLGPLKEPNIADRIEGLRREMMTPDESGVLRWKELKGSPADNDSNMTLTMEIVQAFADHNVSGFAPVVGHPLRSGRWEEYVDRNRYKNITYVAGDAGTDELRTLDQGYVEGLVGQLPYSMGSISAQTLYDVIVQNSSSHVPSFIGTNVVLHLQVPLKLPELKVNNNLLGILKYVGYSLCFIITASAIVFAVWLYRNRNMPVVRVAQPIFLIMIIVGIVVLALTIIPLSFDDGGHPEKHSHFERTSMCMSIPWLASTGFTITFSALYAKTRRVNIIINSSHGLSRVSVSARDVLIPFFALMTANTIVLTVWTILDPLVYTRQNLPGRDGWRRPIATYGSCRSANYTSAFLIPLSFINLSALLLANWQAYEARTIESEFSESKYIALAMASLLQTMLCGIPVILVVDDAPRTFYLVTVMMLFVICASVLLLIFIPKVKLAHKMRNCNIKEQRRLILNLNGAIVRRQSAIMSQRQSVMLSKQLSKPRLLELQEEDDEHESSPSHNSYPAYSMENSMERAASSSHLTMSDHEVGGWDRATGTTMTMSLPTCNEDVASLNEKDLSMVPPRTDSASLTGNESPSRDKTDDERPSSDLPSSDLPSPAASQIITPEDDDLSLDGDDTTAVAPTRLEL